MYLRLTKRPLEVRVMIMSDMKEPRGQRVMVAVIPSCVKRARWGLRKGISFEGKVKMRGLGVSVF